MADPGFGPTTSKCPQCNLFHPTLRPGEVCPLAPVKGITNDGKPEEVNVNKFIMELKNIILANIEKKKIKNVKKLFMDTVIEISKFLENYKE